MAKGKPLESYLEEFYEVTGKTSEITRNLSLAGVAIIWLFKNPEGSNKLLDSTLATPLIWIVISLSIDLVQYLYLSICIKIFHLYYEKKLLSGKITEQKSKSLLYPSILDYISLLFFFAKIICMIIGYYYIYMYLSSKL